MTVVFLDPVGTLGGAERSLVDLVASLRAARPRLRIGLIVGAEGPLVGEIERHGVEVRVLPLPARASRAGDSGIDGPLALARRSPSLALAAGELGGYALALRRAVSRFEPTLVHSNGMKMHLLSALTPLTGVPVVWHLRDYVGQRPLMARALRVLASRADGLLAISESVAEDASRVLARRDVTVVYNAVDVSRFTPRGESVDLDVLAGLAPAPPGGLRIGLVATYARWKGQELFLEAAARLRGRLPNARFYVIGGPAYATEASQLTEGELQAAIDARGLRGVAGLVPFQASPERAYRALDVVVHASTRPEPFGRTIAEAMACGRAVIVAREGGASELIEDGVDALGVSPRDAAALADAIARLAGDPPLREALGAAGRAAATRRFARERLGPEVLAAYARLSARGVAASGLTDR